MKTTENIVNDVMMWLNKNYGLSLPVLPVVGWKQSMVLLWRKAVNWEPGPAPMPQRIEVKGDWQPFSGCAFVVTRICIDIREAEKVGSQSLSQKRKAI